jgi:AcrR family transcriptional regulator
MMNAVAARTSGRRERQREERRAAIVEVAKRHFRDHGYGGTTMSGIAADLGGSKGTLWAYFTSKEELFEATLDSWIEEFGPIHEIAPDADLHAILSAYCAEFLAIMLRPAAQALYRLVIAEAQRFPEIGRIFYERAPLRRQQTLARLLAQYARTGELAIDDPLTASAQFHQLCLFRVFMFSIWQLDAAPGPAEVSRDVEATVRLFLDGCRGRSPLG